MELWETLCESVPILHVFATKVFFKMAKEIVCFKKTVPVVKMKSLILVVAAKKFVRILIGLVKRDVFNSANAKKVFFVIRMVYV